MEVSMTTLGWKRVSVVLLLCATTAIASPAQTFKVLATFNGTDGESPEGAVIQGTDGNFYGTTAQGGAHYYGSVFKITPAGKMTTLYGFGAEPNCTDGGQPVAALVQGTDGNFYGTTYFGGAKSTICGVELYFGYGTIFKITPAGNLTTLYSFCSLSNCADGEYPLAGLLQAIDGNFYGTTEWGGANGAGTIFKITPGGVLTTVYSFCSKANCADGAYPFSGLIQSADGTFYGTTEGGGVSVSYCSSGGGFACGTVFEITPSGKLTTLYTFCSVKNCPDGSSPFAGLIQDANGNFYGTTSAGGYLGSQNSTCYDSGGCGTIFEIGSDRKFHTLHAFCMQHGCPDGMWPIAGLIQATDGKLYGVASAGGSSNTCEVGCGTIFRITSDGAFTVLYSLTNTDGAQPSAGLLQGTRGDFYGTTFADMGWEGPGTVFSLSMGLEPFVTFVRGTAKVGKWVEILGQGFTGTSGVSFNGAPAAFKVKSPTYLAAEVPAGATTGPVTVMTPSGTLTSNLPFRVRPQLLSFNPTSGAVGTHVTITGVSLTQTIGVSFGGVPATSFTVNSDTQVTATVPTGALSGHIGITTAGGRTWSTADFTVTQ
jgi:uncharacterized repeat protein (TIGR03803 family)